jgi:hypothetical protein
MNLVERFFGDLTAFITEKSFASTREPANATIIFLADRNDNPRRYVWKAKGEIQYTRGPKVLRRRQFRSRATKRAVAGRRRSERTRTWRNR